MDVSSVDQKNYQRCAWRLRIRGGMEEEYERRHQELWPELRTAIYEQGRRNFTIFRDGQDVFLYAEIETNAILSTETEEILARWKVYMSDVILTTSPVEDQQPHYLKEIFHMD